jgi:hypothetical protein
MCPVTGVSVPRGKAERPGWSGGKTLDFIPEVLCSNLGRNFVYPEEHFCDFVHRGEYVMVPQVGRDHFLSTIHGSVILSSDDI